MQQPTEMKISDVVSALLPHPAVQAALAETARQKAEARRALAARLTAITAAAAKAAPKTRTAIDAARAELALAEKARAAAVANLQRLQRDAAGAAVVFTREHDALERQLISGADPAIEAFLVEMRDIITNPPQPSVAEEFTRTHPVTGRKEHVVVTNWTAAHRYLEAVREAVHTAEGLRLLPDQSEVPRMLDELRAGLPRFDTTPETET